MPLKDVLELGFHGQVKPMKYRHTDACGPDYRHMTLEDFLRHAHDMVQEGALTISDPATALPISDPATSTLVWTVSSTRSTAS